MMDEPAPKRRTGRPPKYDWTDKRDLCHKLYVEEQKSAAEIAKYFAETFNVAPNDLPCRKGFLRQFQAWGFPSRVKKLSEEDEPVVLARIKELWEQNINQKDIKRTLGEEGWELKDYEFSKLWKKIGLRLRNEQGYKVPDVETKKKRKRSSTGAVDNATSEAPDASAEVDGEADAEAVDDDVRVPISGPMAPEEAAARAQRLFEIQLESDQRLSARKRRRRIRGYGHLPPDAPGTAPRYNSETSLDECKAYLNLANETYQAVRKEYEAICREMGIKKKTECAEGVWEESKRQLIRENMHLSAVMHPLQAELEMKGVALDCLCCDVTKRLRVQGKAITIAEANNILGFNPEESKTVRRSLYEIFAADNFESRLVSGEDHWQELRQNWFDTNETLKQVVAEGDQSKMKAVDLLCSDAQKRFREDKNKRGERVIVQRNARYGPGPGPAWAATASRTRNGAVATANEAPSNGTTPIREPRARAAVEGRGYPQQPNGNFITNMGNVTGGIDFDLDPALSTSGTFGAPDLPPAQSIPAYFRLSTASALINQHQNRWLGQLSTPSIAALHSAALSKAGPVVTVTKVHGIIKNQDGTENNYVIDEDEELQVYLEAAGEKASFLVALAG